MITYLFVVPSGPRSRVYIRLSLPQFEGRLGRALESNDIQDALNAIEEFLVCLSPVHYFECFLGCGGHYSRENQISIRLLADK